MTEAEVFGLVFRLLEAKGIEYYVTGSFAAAAWGRPRASHDLDLVVVAAEAAARDTARALADGFAVDEEAFAEAARTRGRANAIHIETAVKIDLWFVDRAGPQAKAFDRRRRIRLGPAGEAWVASAEDAILAKLRWCQRGAGGRQIEDVRGILDVQGEAIDAAALDREAAAEGLTDLLERARRDGEP